MPNSSRFRAIVCVAVVVLLSGFVAMAAHADNKPVKQCPLNDSEMAAQSCPDAGGVLRDVDRGVPQQFYACAICRRCWSGVRVKAGASYQIRVIGDPDTWMDKDISFPTADAALTGFHRVSDARDMPWWSGWFLDAIFRWQARKRPVRDADWFQLFTAVGTPAGGESAPIRITMEGRFVAPAEGELFTFVNDHPNHYDNNSGRMILEIGLAN